MDSTILSRHPELLSTVGQTIELGRVKDTTKEALMTWFDAFKHVIDDLYVSPENIYNFDKSGFSIGKIEATRVIINSKLHQRYQVQPGRQKCVSVMECICADGTWIDPLIIFKGENISAQWIPPEISLSWKVLCNTKGWMSNQHGLEWLRRCFEPSTWEKAKGQTRILICD